MKLSKLKILSEKEIKKIHSASLEILSNTGVKILSKSVLDFLNSFDGINIDIKTGIAKFCPDLINKVIKDIPRSFKLFNQNKGKSIIISEDNFYLINGHCAAFFLDSKEKKRRRILKEDVKKFAILCDYIENIEIVGIEGLPEDIADQKLSFIEGAKLTLLNSNKPFHYVPEYIYENKAIKDILKIITDNENLSEKPSAICQVTMISPLGWPKDISEILLENSLLGIPIIIVTSPYSGVSAPITTAGQVTLFNAEILSGIVINQLAKQGNPVVYGCACATFDMSEFVTNIATPETVLMRIAAAQMADFYKIPSLTSAPDTDSNCYDEQNGWEKVITTFCAFASGMNLLVNAGLFSTGTEVSYEQLIIDSEIVNYANRLMHSISVDKERIAADVVNDVGPLGNFLLHDHTLKFLRSEENYHPLISNRAMYAKWKDMGRLPVDEVALNRAEDILKKHNPNHLSNSKVKEANRCVKLLEQSL